MNVCPKLYAICALLSPPAKSRDLFNSCIKRTVLSVRAYSLGGPEASFNFLSAKFRCDGASRECGCCRRRAGRRMHAGAATRSKAADVSSGRADRHAEVVVQPPRSAPLLGAQLAVRVSAALCGVHLLAGCGPLCNSFLFPLWRTVAVSPPVQFSAPCVHSLFPCPAHMHSWVYLLSSIVKQLAHW
jgi:hypothetical protein